ncbi:MAG: WD40 repeat protein/serine/threonine protein kinase [Planctomycetota bacterium]|jgi:WD40 repeat protein/serine/threonine protein kinase
MPERANTCPDPTQLAEFHAGWLSEEAVQRIAQHTKACAACREALSELALNDEFELDLQNVFSRDPSASSGMSNADVEYAALVALLRESAEGERYEILGELGRGGMGIVFDVRDRVLQRDLAMKVVRKEGRGILRSSSRSSRGFRRFLEEARVTAQLDHPSIIPVHDMGVDSEDHAFFTMSKVRGKDLQKVLEEFGRGEGEWTLRRLVVVLLRVCDALAFAHSRHVVHRDLKPANIMVGRFSAVYVMDWGVAKFMGVRNHEEKSNPGAVKRRDPHTQSTLFFSAREPSADEAEHVSPLFTLDGEIIGTPAYMAPEQAEKGYLEVDSRADIYSVGSILYQLLCGRRPFGGPNGEGTPRDAWKQLLAGPPEPLARIAAAAPPELVSVCERAMQRKPAERYADMEQFAADLRAWQEGRVVGAYQTGVVPELRKWVGRNRALTSLAIIASFVVISLFTRQVLFEGHARTVLLREASTLGALGLIAESPSQALLLAMEGIQADEHYFSRSTLLEALVPQAQDVIFRGAQSTKDLRQSWTSAGDRFVIAEHAPQQEKYSIRIWDVQARGFAEDSFALPFIAAPLAKNRFGEYIAVFDPDGRWVASGGADGSIIIHELDSGKSRVLANGTGKHSDRFVSDMAVHPNGELLASASWDGSVRLWSVTTGALEQVLEGHTGIISSIEFDSTGGRLLSASGVPLLGYETDQTVRVWDVASGNSLSVLAGHDGAIPAAHFDPTGDLVVSASYDQTARIWNAHTGKEQQSFSFPGVVWEATFSPNGSTLAVAFDSGLLIRDMTSGREHRLGPYKAHKGCSVNSVEFSPRGDRLLTTGNDRVARIWTFEENGRPQLDRRLHNAAPLTGSWSPRGSTIATQAIGGLNLWFARGNPVTDNVQLDDAPVRHVRIHPEGDRVLAMVEDGLVREYRFAPGVGLTFEGTLGERAAVDVMTTADGNWTLVAEKGGPLRLWRRDEQGLSHAAGELALDVQSLHSSRASQVIALILTGKGAATIDLSRAKVEVVLHLQDEVVTAAHVSEDGARVALGSKGGLIQVVELSNGRVLLESRLPGHTAYQTQVFDVRFYAGGQSLVSSGPGLSANFWDVEAGVLNSETYLGATTGGLFVLGDGRSLICRDQWGSRLQVRGIQDASEQDPLQRPGRDHAHRNRISAWSLDQSQERLLSTSFDHSTTVWDLKKREAWITFAGHQAPVLAGDITPDGAWAVTGDANGKVFVWPVDPLPWSKLVAPIDTAELAEWK